MTAASAVRVIGDAPWFPGLEPVMSPAKGRLDELASAYVASGAVTASKEAWWFGFSGFVLETTLRDTLGGQASLPLREALWLQYATTYWSMLEQQRTVGVPRALAQVPKSPPSEVMVAGMVEKLTGRQ